MSDPHDPPVDTTPGKPRPACRTRWEWLGTALLSAPLGCAFVLLPLVAGCNLGSHAVEAERLTAREVARAAERGPEPTLRQFFLAFLEQDRPTLERLTLGCPGREELWSFGQPITNPARRVEFLESGMRRVALGEVVLLPSPEDLAPVRMNENHLNDGRMVILLDDERSLPWILVRTGGVWRVDPFPFVAAIKVGKEPPPTAPARPGGFNV